MTRSTVPRKPRSSVQSVILYTSQNSRGEWIPTEYKIGSWVTLKPGSRGGHGRESKKYGGDILRGAFKGQILKFETSVAGEVKQVLVQHAYMHREVQVDPSHPLIEGACNYLYPSRFTDWQDPLSIIGIICVIHADVGEATRGNRTHKELLEHSVFFYNSLYIPGQKRGEHGRVSPIPLPDFSDPQWPVPDMASTEAFRAKLRSDFLSSMKPSIGSRITHLQWFMPVHIMADLFSVAISIHRTITTFVFKNPTEELLDSLMDEGWNIKVTVGADIIKCTVDCGSVVFRYHIGRNILYTNFEYNRDRLIGKIWEPMELRQAVVPVKLLCELGNSTYEIEAAEHWLLGSLRQEIMVTFGSQEVFDSKMWIVREGIAPQKINMRNEMKMTVRDILVSPHPLIRMLPSN